MDMDDINKEVASDDEREKDDESWTTSLAFSEEQEKKLRLIEHELAGAHDENIRLKD